MLKLTGYIII